MYLRPHKKTKNGTVYEYWSLVKSVRTERGPRQRIVASIGKMPGLDRRTRLGWDQIGAALDGRIRQADLFEQDDHEPEWATVDVSRVRVERMRDFGDVYLALALWRRLHLDRFFDEQMASGKEEIPWAQVACILSLARFCAPSSELKIAEHWYGKTALMEALLLLLTGWHGTARPVADLISRSPAPGGESDGPPMDRCDLSAEVVLGDKGQAGQNRNGAEEIKLSWTKEHDDTRQLPMPAGIGKARIYYDENTDDRELTARVCGFFQDRVDRLFDAAATGRTFRDVFEPAPLSVKQVIDYLGQAIETIKEEKNKTRYRDEWPGKDCEELNEDLRQQWGKIAGMFHQLRDSVPDWPTAPQVPDRIVDDGDLDGFARGIVAALKRPAGELRYGRLRKDFSDSILDTLDY